MHIELSLAAIFVIITLIVTDIIVTDTIIVIAADVIIIIIKCIQVKDVLRGCHYFFD